MKKVFVFLATGFEEVEALTPVDVLRRAGVDVTVVSVTGHLDVVGAHQLLVRADKHFLACTFKEADMLVLPGGMPGADNLFAHEGLKQILLNAAARDTTLAAICAAPYILGELGLLKGKQATCYPGFENRLKGAQYLDQPVVVDKKLITAKGVGAAMSFSLALVRELHDAPTAQKLAERMMCS